LKKDTVVISVSLFKNIFHWFPVFFWRRWKWWCPVGKEKI